MIHFKPSMSNLQYAVHLTQRTRVLTNLCRQKAPYAELLENFSALFEQKVTTALLGSTLVLEQNLVSVGFSAPGCSRSSHLRQPSRASLVSSSKELDQGTQMDPEVHPLI